MARQQRWSAIKALALLALARQPVQAVAGGGCSGSPAACQASADDEASASLGLLQFSSAHASSHQGNASAGTGAGAGGGEVGGLGAEDARVVSKLLASRGLGGTAGILPGINCGRHATLCDAPFNCKSNPPTLQEMMTWGTKRLSTEDGHSNLKPWCLAPMFEDGIAKLCLKNHDLKGNAQVTYDLQVGHGIGELDGSYCFLEGLCTNTDVTYDTTLEEAEGLCDAKYGHERWTSISGATLAETALLHPGALSFLTGFHTRALSSVFGQLACAMGNYHCDVIYCRETYCKNPHYVKRYGHYLKKYGWA